MTVQELKAKIKSGAVSGFYILAGEEDYLKNHYRAELHRTVVTDEAFETFNYTSFDGIEMNIAALRDALMAPPMMADYKLVEWRGADLDKMKEGERTELLRLAEAKEDYPYAVLVIIPLADGFDTGTEKRPSKLYNRLAEHFDVVLFPKSTDAQLIGWLRKHFEAEGVRAEGEALSALLFRSGRSMQILHSEVEKLCSYAKAHGRAEISTADVNEIASSTVECDAFAISNAIIEKNMEKAFLALTDMKLRRVEPQAVLAQLARTYSDLVSISLLVDEGRDADTIARLTGHHPFRLKLYMGAAKKMGTKNLSDSLARLIKVDSASKFGGTAGYKAIEMFITQNI